MKSKEFGKTQKGQDTTLYTFSNAAGMEVSVIDLGATLHSIFVPDKAGNLLDVVLGYDDPQSYENGVFFGATVGRNANRIREASFILNGKKYELDKNEGRNNLHSGFDYYKDRVWKIREITANSITFRLYSPDGDQGFPGNLNVDVKYTLTDENELCIDYFAKADQDTIVNMTNHSYFNMDGHDSGSVLDQNVWIDADVFAEVDRELIPTGKLIPVENTPMDFRVKKRLGKDIEADYETLRLGSGYDHNWGLNNHGEMKKIAELSSKASGITMEVYTDLPGVQIYAGNSLDQVAGKNACVYGKNQGICFETQYFPDAVNRKEFKSPVVRAGDVYRTTTVYKFRLE